MLKRCIYVKKLIEMEKCHNYRELDAFVQSGVLQRQGNELIVKDIEYLRKYFKNHCEEIIKKYETVTNIGIYPKSISSLNNCIKLYNFLKNSCETGDFKSISVKVFNDSKTIQNSSLLKKITLHFFNENKIKFQKFYNMLFVRCSEDSDISFDNEDIGTIICKNKFFTCFANRLNAIKCNADYVVIFENLTPFFQAIPNNALFIYCSGFQNISNISSQIKDIGIKKIIHFGDVDPSGLAIADILLSENENATFYPDIITLKEILQIEFTPIFAERKYAVGDFKSEILKDIALLMKNKNHIRIEQEFVLKIWNENLLKIPKWVNMASTTDIG